MSEVERVAIHPIVLLSIADHHNRLVDSHTKRVIGILLGDVYKGQMNILQSFAVPFDEDPNDPSVWFVDTNYIEEMYSLHRKVTLKERILGWYSSRSTVSENDLDIHQLMRNFTPDPVFVTTDVGASDPHEIPAAAFFGTERVRPDGRPIVTSFRNVLTVVDFLEVEDIGVEHLLRDIKDVDMSKIGTTINNSIHGLAALEHRLTSISAYLADVMAGKLPYDSEIVGIIQHIFNLLPNVNLEETLSALSSKADDSAFMIFISQLCRAIVSVHDYVNEKVPLQAPAE